MTASRYERQLSLDVDLLGICNEAIPYSKYMKLEGIPRKLHRRVDSLKLEASPGSVRLARSQNSRSSFSS